MKKFLPKLLFFVKKNYFITIFILAIIFVGFVSSSKILFSKPTYIYARVKLGQGLWWAQTAKPSIWYINSIKKGEVENDLLGRPIAEILEVRYYPAILHPEKYETLYDVYLTLKLAVKSNKKSKKMVFKRSAVAVGSPVEFEFPSAQVTGTVIDLIKENFEDKYSEKTIYLISLEGYKKDLPFAFDNIKVNDKYFDGVDYVFEVLDKSLKEKIFLAPSSSGRTYENLVSTFQNIIVKAKIKVKEKNNQLVYAEEQIVKVGSYINFTTSNYDFRDFVILKIE